MNQNHHWGTAAWPHVGIKLSLSALCLSLTGKQPHAITLAAHDGILTGSQSFAKACTGVCAALTEMIPHSRNAQIRLCTSSSLCAAERLILNLQKSRTAKEVIKADTLSNSGAWAEVHLAMVNHVLWPAMQA